MILLALLVSCMGFTFDLDSGSISWPQNSWTLVPITSTSWHSAQTVSLSVSFNPTTSVSAGVVQLLLPSGFSKTVVSAVITSPIVSGEDYTISFPNFLLPSQGIYGPIGILTRASATGAIMDSNRFFCTLAIAGPMPVAAASSLTATFYDITKVYVQSPSSIYFNFQITQDLWKFDVFYLYLDSHFSLASPTCKSLKVIGEYNNLNSTNPQALNTLSCFYDAGNNRVVVYGLGVDIYVGMLSSTGSLTGSLLVTGFTNPNADYASSVYSWSLYIGRYGLSTYFAAYKGSGPSTEPGSITVPSWLPHSGYNVASIVLGMTLYMDLTMTFSHSIPAAGQIYIEFSGGIDNVIKAWRDFTDETQSDTTGDTGYYLISPAIGGTCTLTATKMTCSGFSSAISAGTITITTYSNFISTNPSVIQIISYVDQGTTVIDQVTANPVTVTYAVSTSVVIASAFQLYFATDPDTANNYYATVGPVAAYVVAAVQLPVASSASTYSITMPLSTSSYETTVMLPATAVGKGISSATLTTDLSSGTTSVTGISVSTNTLAFTATVAINNYYTAIFYENNGGVAGSINLPNVASNLYTRYEVIFKVTISSILYVYSRAVSFIPDTPTVSFNLLCKDSGTAGIPATVSFSPNFSYSVQSGVSSLYISITISGTMSNNFDSGLSTGQAYPFSSGSTGSLYCSFATSPTLIWTGFTSVTSGTSISITFPMGSLTDLANYSASLVLYYINPSMSGINNVIISSTSATVAAAVNVANWATQTITTGTSYSTSLSISALTMSLAPATGTSATSGTIGVLLPTGYSVAAPSFTGTTAMTGVYAFTSTNMYYKTPGIFASLSASNALGSSATSFTLGGVVTASYFNPSSPSSGLTPIQASSTPNLSCLSLTGTHPTLSLTASGITSPTFSPTSSVGGGPDSLTLNITASFVNTHLIPKGGTITFSLQSSWVVTSISQLFLHVNQVDITATITSSLGMSSSFSSLPEIAANSPIEIFLYNLVPPSNVATTPVAKSILTSISTYATADTTQQIDQWLDTTANAIQLSTSNAQGNVTLLSADIFPNSTSSSAFLRVQFSAAHTLPIGGTITLTSPTNAWINSGDLSTYCYCSLAYTSCMAASSLTITLAESYLAGSTLTVIVDNNLLLANVGQASNTIVVTTAYGGYTIDTNAASPQSVVVGSALAVVAAAVTYSPNTAGEIANYTLNITTSVAAGSTFQLVFPSQFDTFLGEVTEKYVVTDPGSYYLDCYTSLGDLDCEVHHRIITFTLASAIVGSASFNFSGIYNPAYSAALLPSLKLYASNSTGSLLYANENIILAGVAAVPQTGVTFRQITVSNNYLQQTATYVFQFYLGASSKAGDMLVLEFPEMFEITRDSVSAFASTLQVVNTAVSLSTYTAINGSAYCTDLLNNQLSFNITQDVAWNTSMIAVLTVSNIPNPDWGLAMTTALDSNVYVLYPEWTSQFSIKLVRSGSYQALSCANLNTAYTGLNSNPYSFVANGYMGSGSTGVITVIKGTQTPVMYITTSAFQSKIAQVNPNNVNNLVTLTYSSSASFKIYNGQTYVPFQISAPIDAETSLNYITWSLVEVALDGGATKYVEPVKTPVEVYNSTVAIAVDAIATIAIGSSSPPIAVSLPYAPHTSLQVMIAPSSKNVTVSPSSLTFTAGVQALYYQLTVGANYSGTAGDSINVTYTLQGVDSAAYNVQTSQFKIGDATSTTVAISGISFNNVGAQRVRATVSTSVATVLCWEFAEKNTPLITYDEVINSTASLVGNNSQPTFTEQVTDYFNAVDKSPNTGETWQSFEHRVYKNFIQQVWLGCIYSGSTTTTLFDADWLWADTTYQLLVFAGSSVNSSATVTTSYYGDALNITVFVAQTVDKTYLPTILNGLAASMGVLSQQVLQGSTLLGSTSSTLTYTLYGNRYSSLTPAVNYASLNTASFVAVLTSIGIIATPSFSTTSLTKSSYSTSDLTVLSQNTVSAFSASMKANATVSGQVCCVAEPLANLTGSINATQIYLGIDRNNAATFGRCQTYNATAGGTTVSLNSLNNGTKYSVSCVACNAYPVWPGCGKVSEYNLTTNTSDTSSTGTVVSQGGVLAISLGVIGILSYF